MERQRVLRISERRERVQTEESTEITEGEKERESKVLVREGI